MIFKITRELYCNIKMDKFLINQLLLDLIHMITIISYRFMGLIILLLMGQWVISLEVGWLGQYQQHLI